MKNGTDVCIVVPVKCLREAKGRLAGIMSPCWRRRLVVAMLHDTLSTCAHPSIGADIVVVGTDPEISQMAESFGATWVDEGTCHGMNQAVELGIAAARTMNARVVVIVPVDVPHLSLPTLQRLIRACSFPASVAMVPASRDGGTNLIAFSPVHLRILDFGVNSFARHINNADREGAAQTVLRDVPEKLDLDRPQDVTDYVALSNSGVTRATLLEFFEEAKVGRIPEEV